MKQVLLLGATGFIGSRILHALQAHQGVAVSILTRRQHGLAPTWVGRMVVGNITDLESVEKAVSGADVVINSVSYVGRDPKVAEMINTGGTLNVVTACEQFAVRRLIQISSTAVYGSGPHRELAAETANYAPESVASKARALADQAVLAAGGTVVRPNLVYGPGDRWFIPGLIKMFSALGSTVNNGTAKLSLIDVTDLGELVAALATTTAAPSGAYHAADPTPVTLGRLLEAVQYNIAPLALAGTCSAAEAVQQLASLDFSSHQVKMLSLDHHYESARLWEISGLQPRGFRLATADSRDWYRNRLALSGSINQVRMST